MRRKGRRFLGRALPAIALAAFALALTGSVQAAFQLPIPDPATGVGSVRAISLGPKTVVTWCVASAPDGSVWTLGNGYFSKTGTDDFRLSHVLPDGSLQQYTVPDAVNYGWRQCMAVDAAGKVWFTTGTTVVQFNPAGDTWRTFTPPRADGSPGAIVAGANGSVWFANPQFAAVGMIDSSGSVHEFPLPATFSAHPPNAIAAMPDGTIWVNAISAPTTGQALITLEELSPQGALLRMDSIPSAGVTSLAAGPGGLPWFGYGAVPWGIGRVEPGNKVQILPWTFFSEPTAMVLGPDGRMWFAADDFDNGFGYYNLATKRDVVFKQPNAKVALSQAIAVGPDGSLALVSRDPNLYLLNTDVTSSQTSTIANSLPTPGDVFASATTLAIGGAISIGAILFLTFPSQLFNLTFQENYDEIKEWWRRATRRLVPDRRKPSSAARATRDWAAFGAVLLLGALAGALLDPHFGSSIATVYTYIAIVLAICVGITIPAVVTSLYHRVRHEDQAWKPHALVGGTRCRRSVCPGFAIDTVSARLPVWGDLRHLIRRQGWQGGKGAYHRVVDAHHSRRGHCRVAGLGACPACGGLRRAQRFRSSSSTTFSPRCLSAGWLAPMIGLLPLRFLPGWDLRTWHQGAWLACFGFVVLAFVEVLLLPHNDNHSNVPLVTTIVLLVVFGGLSVGMREWFARRRHHSGEGPHSLRERVEELLTPVDTSPPVAHEAQETGSS